jgi:DNA-directed RNA polymerase sigma subunit (sigma70/sigma32)
MLSNLDYSVLFDIVNLWDRKPLDLRISRSDLECNSRAKLHSGMDRNSLFHSVDQSLRQVLPLYHLRLVGPFLRRWARSGLGPDEIRGWGELGLTEAATKIDISRNVPFGSYAIIYMRQKIAKAVESNLDGIRFPYKFMDRAYKISKLSHDSPVEHFTIADRLFMRSDPYLLFQKRRVSNYFLDGLTAGSESVGDPEYRVKDRTRKTLDLVIRNLSFLERKVIRKIYGLRQDPVPRDLLAQMLKLNESQIQEIHDSALKKLQARIPDRLISWDECFEQAS